MFKLIAALSVTTVAVTGQAYQNEILAEHERLMKIVEEQELLPEDLRDCDYGDKVAKRAAPDVTYFARVRVRVPRSG